MKQYLLTVGLTFLMMSCATSQKTDMTITEDVPYREIPEAPADYTATNVAARLIDGLGYRMYWATEGLTDADLTYKISEDSRDFAETMEHLHGLSNTIYNAVAGIPNDRSAAPSTLTWKEKRDENLRLLKKASDLLRAASPEAMEDMKVIFKRGDGVSEFPFWNNINGPIADALNHVGQVLAFRRAAGNPQPPGVNVFTGKTF